MKKFIWLLLFAFLYAEPLLLTPQEKKIIKMHPLKCISTGLWAPFNLVENQKLVGIGLDYWNLIRKKLGIKNGCKIAQSWTQVLSEIKNKTSDITIAGILTQDRLKYATFSKAYDTYPIVIATKNDVGFIHNIDLLKDKTIVVGKGYAISNILKKYPYLHVKYVESLDVALALIDQGKAYATLDILPVLAYKLNKNYFSKLKISGSIPYEFGIRIMLGKSHEEIVPLINKAIDAISEKERNKINKKWITIHNVNTIESKYFYTLLASAFFLFFIFLIWLFLLKKEIIIKNKKTKELQKLVSIDSLTKIYNRYMLDSTLDKEILLAKRYNAPLSIIFFDIDNFKKINDTYGHKVGDYILKELSEVISNSIRKSDVFGRWGGDEFLIILVNTSEDNAKVIAKNLETKIAKYDFTEQIIVRCTFGITSYHEGDSRIDMIQKVDTNYYKEKNLKFKIENEY